MRVNCNVSALIANNSLKRTDKRLSDSLERLSSGLKVANAKDNPSGLAMSRRMNTQIEGLGVANNDANDGISIVQIADGSLQSIHEILQRMNELANKASTDTLNDDDRQIIQSEITQLKDEIERIAATTQYNGQTLLDGSFDLKGYARVGSDPNTAETDKDAKIKIIGFSDVMEAGDYEITGLDVTFSTETGPTGVVKNKLTINNPGNVNITRDGNDYFAQNKNVTVNEDVVTISDSEGKKIQLRIDKNFSDTLQVELTTTGSMTMQVGANEGQVLDIRIPKVSLSTLGIYNLDVSTNVEARMGLDSIKNAISVTSSIRSRLGSYQNRLEHTSGNLDISVENMTAAYSRIMDVDMAEEMTEYSTQQVLSQAGMSMLAQANERPSQVLQLLQ